MSGAERDAIPLRALHRCRLRRGRREARSGSIDGWIRPGGAAYGAGTSAMPGGVNAGTVIGSYRDPAGGGRVRGHRIPRRRYLDARGSAQPAASQGSDRAGPSGGSRGQSRSAVRARRSGRARGSRPRRGRPGGGGSRRAAGAPPGGGGSAAAARGGGRPYLAPGPDWPDGREQALAQVVADGPWGDPGQVRQLGQRIALVLWHGAIVTVQRSLSILVEDCSPIELSVECPGTGSSACQSARSTGPLRSLHIRSTTRPGFKADGTHRVPNGQRSPLHASHHRRDPSRRRSRRSAAASSPRPPTRPVSANAGHDHDGRRRHDGHPGRRRSPTATDGTASASASGIFGFFFILFFLFIVFALIRAIFWGGRGRLGRRLGRTRLRSGGWYGDKGAERPRATAAGSRAPTRRSTTGTGRRTTRRPHAGEHRLRIVEPPAPPTPTGMA